MNVYKHEVQNRCSKCNYAGYDFKLYDELVEVDYDLYKKTGTEIIVCPECRYKERV